MKIIVAVVLMAQVACSGTSERVAAAYKDAQGHASPPMRAPQSVRPAMDSASDHGITVELSNQRTVRDGDNLRVAADAIVKNNSGRSYWFRNDGEPVPYGCLGAVADRYGTGPRIPTVPRCGLTYRELRPGNEVKAKLRAMPSLDQTTIYPVVVLRMDEKGDEVEMIAEPVDLRIVPK